MPGNFLECRKPSAQFPTHKAHQIYEGLYFCSFCGPVTQEGPNKGSVSVSTHVLLKAQGCFLGKGQCHSDNNPHPSGISGASLWSPEYFLWIETLEFNLNNKEMLPKVSQESPRVGTPCVKRQEPCHHGWLPFLAPFPLWGRGLGHRS